MSAPRLKRLGEINLSGERSDPESVFDFCEITASDSSCYIYFMSIIQLCEVCGMFLFGTASFSFISEPKKNQAASLVMTALPN